MARDPSWKVDIQDAVRKESWALSGPNRIVKVKPFGDALVHQVAGYVCLEKVLVGKSPLQIEALLGAKTGSMIEGLRAYRLLRIPLSYEVEYELTAKYPDGQAYNPAMHSDKYLPGSAAVHQWRLLVDVPAEHLYDLLPGETYRPL